MKKLLTVLLILSATWGTGAFTVDSLKLRYDAYTALCSPEKLYLHVDRTYFAAGETLWFKGYLKNASTRTDMQPSNFIYVELLGDEGEVLSRVKIKRESDGFPGNIRIPDDIRSGNYVLRAYTLWQLNSSADYMFTQRIKIIGSEGPAEEKNPRADSILVSFYPEGGRHFDGIRSKMAFKVMDNHGRSIELFGYIKDGNGTLLRGVATTHDGMGVFDFVSEAGQSYVFEDTDGRRFPLPPAAQEGGVVSLTPNSDSYIIQAAALSGPPCTIIVRDADNVFALAKMPADGQVRSFLIKKSLFRPGINHLMMVSDYGAILSERLFYVYGDEALLPACSVSADIPSARHGLIDAHITLKDSVGGPAAGARLSMSVVRADFSQYTQDDNLVSYMGLSSELRGRINSPCHYFDTSVPRQKRENDMDVLMMVQGWRYYDMKKLISHSAGKITLNHMREYAQTLKGRIVRPRGRKMPDNYVFGLLIPKQKFNKFVDVVRADRFIIDSLDFEEETSFIITCNREGIGADYIPKWTGDIFAPEHKYAMAPGSTTDKPVVQNIPLVSEIAASNTLQAAVVTASPDELTGESLDARRVSDFDFKLYADRTIVEYLSFSYPMFEYDGEQMYNRRYRAFGRASVEGDDWGEDGTERRGIVKLVEDGTETPWWVYDQIRMDEIKTMSVSTKSDYLYNAEGGVVMLKILPGGRRKTEQDESLLYFVPLGYQKPSKFYSPRYDLDDVHAEFDHRNTIYWSPNVDITDGKAEVKFCDTDQQNYPYTVILQGYTSDGRPVYCRTTLSESNFDE